MANMHSLKGITMMKATSDQIFFLKEVLTHQTAKLNLSIVAICTLADCWKLLQRHLHDISETRPIGFGTARDWKLGGLDDSHIETAFRYIMKLQGKRV